MLRRAALLVAVAGLLGLSSLGREPKPHPEGDEQPLTPTVTFKLDWPDGDPEYYELAVDSSGKAEYESRGGPKYQLGAPYSVRFTISDSSRDHVFDAAKALNYFSGNFDYRKGKVAFTGTKTLAYTDASRHFETTYNWSENKTVRQVTDLLQHISTTLECGRALDYLYRHDKLGLNAELKRMDELANSGQLAEIQALGPQLAKIAGDSNVMEIARQKARRLLQRANAALQKRSETAAQR